MTSIGIGIGIGDTGPVFTWYRIDTTICSIAHPYPVHNSVKRGSGITVAIFHHLWIHVKLFKSKTAGSKPEDHQQKTSVLFETSFRSQNVPTSKGKTILKLYNCARYELLESNNLAIFWVNILGLSAGKTVSVYLKTRGLFHKTSLPNKPGGCFIKDAKGAFTPGLLFRNLARFPP